MTVFWTCFPRAAALPLIALHPSGTSATTCTRTRAITSRAHNVWQEALATGPADPTEAPQESPSAAPAVEVLICAPRRTTHHTRIAPTRLLTTRKRVGVNRFS